MSTYQVTIDFNERERLALQQIESLQMPKAPLDRAELILTPGRAVLSFGYYRDTAEGKRSKRRTVGTRPLAPGDAGRTWLDRLPIPNGVARFGALWPQERTSSGSQR